MKTYRLQTESDGSRRVAGFGSAYGAPGAQISTFSTAPSPVDETRAGKCAAKDDTCEGFHTKTSNFCHPHQKAAEKEMAS